MRDGYRIAEAVRALLGPEIVLVAWTGHGQAEDRETPVRAGFDGPIAKPITGGSRRRFLSSRSGEAAAG